MDNKLYYEDFEIGQQLRSPRSYTVTKDNAIRFATEYDPQVMHLDEVKAKDSIFGELVISGWHTSAISMRLKTETDLGRVAGGLVGMGLENIGWPQPVKPGDSLHIVITIIEKRLSNSRPGKGIIKYRAETYNQHDALVMEMVTAVLVPRRQA